MKEKETPVFNIGITPIILIFMSVCLIVFAVLSLENALNDRALTGKTVENQKAYYAAYSKGQEWLADQAKDIKGKAVSEIDQQELMIEEPVGEHQSLRIKAKIIVDPKNLNHSIDLTEMKLVQTGEWNADQSVKVFTGK